jgi:xylulokinase
VYRETGQQEIIPANTVCLVRWLKKYEPETVEQTYKFLLVEDYIIYRLTGKYVTDAALQTSTLCYDIVKDSWHEQHLEYAGITSEKLPELLKPGTAAGNVKDDECGLSENTVVCTSPIDQITGAVGAGNISPYCVTETTGTAMAVCATTGSRIYDPGRRMGLFKHAVRGMYALLPWAPASGILLRWFRDEFTHNLGFADLGKMAEKVAPGADGLLILPHFSGAVCPQLNTDARGVFWGLSLAHGKAHIVRALMESVAFLLKENIDVLDELGCRADRIISLGGAARSPLWNQIKADILNKETVIPASEETTCLGAALIAAAGAGFFPDIQSAAAAMTGNGKIYRPDKENVELYREIYRKYKRINETAMRLF